MLSYPARFGEPQTFGKASKDRLVGLEGLPTVYRTGTVNLRRSLNVALESNFHVRLSPEYGEPRLSCHIVPPQSATFDEPRTL